MQAKVVHFRESREKRERKSKRENEINVQLLKEIELNGIIVSYLQDWRSEHSPQL